MKPFFSIILIFLSFSAIAEVQAGPSKYASKDAAWKQHLELESKSQFKGLSWESIGPVVQGGRIVDLAVHPEKPSIYYAAYASGGVWKTTNGGVTFQAITDQLPTLITGDIALDPQNPDHIWLGTGEANSSRSSYGGLGMFFSNDGGQSWQHRGLKDSDRIARVIVHPKNSQTVYAAALGRLYSKGGERGVYRTQDGGQSWQQLLPGDAVTGAVDLVMHPQNPDILYAALWQRSRTAWNFVENGPGSSVWKTIDGGDNWFKIETGLPKAAVRGRIGLDISQSQPNTLYLSLDNQTPLLESEWDLGDQSLSIPRLRALSKDEFLNHSPEQIEGFIRNNDLDTFLTAEDLIHKIQSDQLAVSDLLDELGDGNADLFNNQIRSLELYRSDNAGQSWHRTHQESIQEVTYTYGYYFGQIRVAPNNPNQVYLMGVPIIRSDDGGQSFKNINAEHVHVDHHALWINPQNDAHLILGNDGGIDESFDHGEHWRSIDAQPVGQFYSVAIDMDTPYHIYGGLQDNGTLKCKRHNDWQSGERCQKLFGGDGMHVNIDPRNSQTRYIGYQFGHYFRRDEKGMHSIRPRDAIGDPALRYNWNTPVLMSDHHPDILYFAANQVFRSYDQGRHWQAISPDLSHSINRGDVPYATITTLDESPIQANWLIAGTDDGKVHITQDGGQNWKDISRGLPKNQWISKVAFSQHQANRVFVTVNAYRNDQIDSWVFVSEKAGKKWKRINHNLPHEPVNVMLEDPVNEQVLYVGTDRGVYVSLDQGQSWQALSSELPNVPVHDLVIHPRERELIAATHGRSFWVLDALPVQDLTQAVQSKAAHWFWSDKIQASRDWYSRPSRWWHQPEKAPSHVFTFWSRDAETLEFSLLDSNQQVLVSHQLSAQAGVNTFTWNLLVDPELALAAEQKQNADEIQDLSQTPYAEAKRLGQAFYIQPGEYQAQLKLGETLETMTLKIEKPEAYKPRFTQPDPIRGK